MTVFRKSHFDNFNCIDKNSRKIGKKEINMSVITDRPSWP
jgi:hypothetical protein